MNINEYDAIIEQINTNASRPDEPSENEYDAIIDDDVKQSNQQIRESMFAASQKDPDHEADVINLSERQNVPRETAEANFDELRAREEFESVDYDALIKDAPITARQMMGRDFAMVGQDDVANLTGFEWLFSAVPKAFELSEITPSLE